jgi:hypothetical protein
MNDKSNITLWLGIVLLFAAGVVGFVGGYGIGTIDGRSIQNDSLIAICKEKHGDMPYNEVEVFCRQYLWLDEKQSR